MRVICVLTCVALLTTFAGRVYPADQQELLERFKRSEREEGFWAKYGERIENAFLIGAMITASVLIPLLTEGSEYRISFRWFIPWVAPSEEKECDYVCYPRYRRYRYRYRADR